MTDAQVVGWIAARRAELNGLEESLARQLAGVRAERDELAVAEKVLARAEAAVTAEAVPVAPEAVSALVGGRSVLLIPHRSPGMREDALPPEYRKIMGILRAAAGPVMAKAVGEKLGIDVKTPGKIEPLRGKLTKLAERGWARKMPDGQTIYAHDNRAPHARARTYPATPPQLRGRTVPLAPTRENLLPLW